MTEVRVAVALLPQRHDPRNCKAGEVEEAVGIKPSPNRTLSLLVR